MPQDRHIVFTFLCLLNLGTQRTKLHVDQFIVLFSPALQFIFSKINEQKQKIGMNSDTTLLPEYSRVENLVVA